MRNLKTILFIFCFTLTHILSAQDTNLKIHYNFENTVGKTVPDESGSGYNATLMNQASVIEMGQYKVLSLGNGTGYLDMKARAGEAIKALENFTVSVYYHVDRDASLSGAGYFLWSFSTLAACDATNGQYIAYRLNAQRIASSPGGFKNEVGYEVGRESAKNNWIHVLYCQNGSTGSLYINGTLAGNVNAMPQPKNFFSKAPTLNWIGRAPFSADNYLKKTLVYDFRVYDKALSATEIRDLSAVTADLDYAHNYGGTVGNFTQLNTELIACNNTINSASKNDYPEIAFIEFRDAIDHAQALVDENKASQNLIDQILSELRNARSAFNLSKGVKFEPKPMPVLHTNKGFKHPGALHTQEDFDRIKALLEAGDPTITAAYEKLKANGYSQSNVATYPVETVVRGGGVGENYMNAARGAAMAYQNALRWKISGEKAHAERAILILNSWADVCKMVGGDSNYALAAGLYGYGFANAAELMRDYEGWKKEDFEKFKAWMIKVWYAPNIGFLRGRNGTWEQGRPGHYWSNWGLCNLASLLSIAILCDDVYMYNQGLSFYKYDQVGSFADNRPAPIVNDGLTEFIGNLVPITHADERGPFGYLGQMQESGRDQGHSLMAVGLAADVCQICRNQGDDLFSLMDNRLAAGIEYVAAYNTGVNDLPWTEYWYHDVRTAIHNSWKMTVISEGGRGQFRPYWDRIIGHYEGVMGVDMPYSRAMREKEPIDNGGGAYGQTSGGFDHMGFSTLTCYRPTKASTEQVPTPIIPTIEYNGNTYNQGELGGLANTWQVKTPDVIPPGSIIKFIPALPDGINDTGNWKWDSGETTKDLQIMADSSAVYRVTYTNEHGVKSMQIFTIAVAGDCTYEPIIPEIDDGNKIINDTVITVLQGSSLTLSITSYSWGWGSIKWNTGATTRSIKVNNIRSDRTYSVLYTNQGGREIVKNFHIKARFMIPSIVVDNGEAQTTNRVVIRRGQTVELKAVVQRNTADGTWLWNTGETTQKITLNKVRNTGHYTVNYLYNGVNYPLDFHVYIPITNKPTEAGDYFIKNAKDGLYLTNTGTDVPGFREKNEDDLDTQIWSISKPGTIRYQITSKADNRFLNELAHLTDETFTLSKHGFAFHGVEDGNLYAIQNNTGGGLTLWKIGEGGTIDTNGGKTLGDYPFEIVATDEDTNGIEQTSLNAVVFYPNPVQDFLRFQLKDGYERASCSVYSVDGSLLKHSIVNNITNQIDCRDLQSGLYILIIDDGERMSSFKFLKN